MNIRPSNTSSLAASAARAPRQAAPVARSTRSGLMPRHAGVMPSVCTPADNNAIGQCFDANGPVPGRFNCAACCALRGAVGWHNPNTGAVVAC